MHVAYVEKTQDGKNETRNTFENLFTFVGRTIFVTADLNMYTERVCVLFREKQRRISHSDSLARSWCRGGGARHGPLRSPQAVENATERCQASPAYHSLPKRHTAPTAGQ